MSAFFSSQVQLPDTTTAVRLVESEDFERDVMLKSTGSFHIGYTSVEATTGMVWESSLGRLQFVLPADEEVWVVGYGFSGSGPYVNTFVSKAAS